MKTMRYISLVLLMLLGGLLYAQEEEPKKKKDKPVRAPWDAAMLLESQTTLVNNANTFEFNIQHRFGPFGSEEFDLGGLYAPSNIRIEFEYGITDNISVGFGTLKYNKIQDLNYKWGILTQTRSGSIPVSVTYHGMTQYDLRDTSNFGKEYTRGNRLSFYNELMVSRKFSDALSLQLSIAHSHFNQIDTISLADDQHDNISVGILGRYKVLESMGVIFNYIQPLTTPEDIQPTMAFGIEYGTSAHSFQLFTTNAFNISQANNMAYNRKVDGDMGFRLGFNITRIWYF